MLLLSTYYVPLTVLVVRVETPVYGIAADLIESCVVKKKKKETSNIYIL